MSFNQVSKSIDEAYNRFVIGIQNRLANGNFLMIREIFMELIEEVNAEPAQEVY